MLGADSEGVADILRLQTLLGHYGLSAWATFDASVVRGLAYYTGVVFEAFDRGGEQRAVCGGGRYDHMLLPMFVVHGEYPTAAAGLKVEDAALEELLRAKGLLTSARIAGATVADVCVSCVSADAAEAAAYRVVRALRSAGISVDMQLQRAVNGDSPATKREKSAKYRLHIESDGEGRVAARLAGRGAVDRMVSVTELDSLVAEIQDSRR